MADLIKIKGGSGDVPTLQDRELAYRTDKETLYIGTGTGNVRLCGAKDISELIVRLETMSKHIEDITARLEKLETPSE